MGHADQLGPESGEVGLLEREAEHKAVARGLRFERKAQRDDVELPRHVLDRAVIRAHPRDTQRGDPGLGAQPGYHFDSST